MGIAMIVCNNSTQHLSALFLAILNRCGRNKNRCGPNSQRNPLRTESGQNLCELKMGVASSIREPNQTVIHWNCGKTLRTESDSENAAAAICDLRLGALGWEMQSSYRYRLEGIFSVFLEKQAKSFVPVKFSPI